MKIYKLKKWAVAAVYSITFGLLAFTFTLSGRKVFTDNEEPKVDNFVSNEIVENETAPVISVTNETVNHPYLNESVTIAKDYYDKKASEDKQINSLIYYKNTYMENTGILYSSKNTFDVVSVLDGTVTSVIKDDILGNVVEIMHTTELITIYHCIENVTVKAGDIVKQNDVIGTSGKLSLDKGYDNALLFEVNLNGSLINPNDFYNMKIKDLIG